MKTLLTKGIGKTLRHGLLAALPLLAIGCSAGMHTTQGTEIVVQENYVKPEDPGSVEFVYEPPLIDVVTIPAGLDPEGYYYRPTHQSIVEIRPGRWKYYQLPEQTRMAP